MALKMGSNIIHGTLQFELIMMMMMIIIIKNYIKLVPFPRMLSCCIIMYGGIV